MVEDADSRPKALVEGIDFTIDPSTGFMVFTARYLSQRGYCCGSGCKHCPYSAEQQKHAGRPDTLVSRETPSND